MSSCVRGFAQRDSSRFPPAQLLARSAGAVLALLALSARADEKPDLATVHRIKQGEAAAAVAVAV